MTTYEFLRDSPSTAIIFLVAATILAPQIENGLLPASLSFRNKILT